MANAPLDEAPKTADVAAIPATAAAPVPSNAAVTPDGAATTDEESAEAADDEGGEDEPVADEGEGESHDVSSTAADANGPHYTADLSDEELAAKWKSAPESLGSVSLGFVDEGRLMNAEHFPDGEAWRVVSPEKAWATHETIEYVLAAVAKVHEQFPNAPPLRVNQISYRDGGYCRPHKSHQNGRDVDLGFYYPTPDPIIVREREKVMDVAANWALVKAVITTGDVQFILVDRRVQKVLYEYAVKNGEDKSWLDSLFHGGAGQKPMLMHARGHRDHFHVRYFNPRAQELGRRVAPLLAQRPEQNIAMHRVRKGDTLGAIARKYGSTVALLQKVNRMHNSFLRLSQVLKVPLRGPCTHCPIPPPIVVPERRLPPALAQAETPVANAALPVAVTEVPVAGSTVLAPPLNGDDEKPEQTRVAAAPASATAPAASAPGATAPGATATTTPASAVIPASTSNIARVVPAVSHAAPETVEQPAADSSAVPPSTMPAAADSK